MDNYCNRYEDNWTMLHYAAQNSQDAEVINYLVSKGLDVNGMTKDGLTPLLIALAWNTNIEISKSLVSCRANINIKFGGNALLHFVCLKQYKAVDYYKSPRLIPQKCNRISRNTLFYLIFLRILKNHL